MAAALTNEAPVHLCGCICVLYIPFQLELSKMSDFILIQIAFACDSCRVSQYNYVHPKMKKKKERKKILNFCKLCLLQVYQSLEINFCVQLIRHAYWYVCVIFCYRMVMLMVTLCGLSSTTVYDVVIWKQLQIQCKEQRKQQPFGH